MHRSEEEAAQVRDLAQYFVGIIYAVEGRDELGWWQVRRAARDLDGGGR